MNNIMRRNMSITKKILPGLSLLLLTLVIPRIANSAAQCLNSHVIHNGGYWVAVLNQLFQGLAAILVLKLLLRKPFSDLGLQIGNYTQGIKYTASFLGIWAGIVIVFYIVCLLFYPSFEQYILSYYQSDCNVMLRTLIYEGTVPGLGEEPLYRALVILPLMNYWTGSVRLGRFFLPSVALISGLIFAAGHINFTFIPFRLISIDYLQITFNLILGIWWGVIFLKTKSLLWSVLAHNGSNSIMYLIGFLTAFHINK